MSEPKFTKGPWYLEKAYRGKRKVSAEPLGEISWHGLAEVVVVHGDGPCEDGEANAQLIAAAPDLYYALDCIMKELPSKRDWLDPVTEAMAKQALNFATGVK
jgi:hypothetical protein